MRQAGSSTSILLLGATISLLGWLAVFSADHLDAPHRVAKQGLILTLGLAIAVALSRCDYRKLRAYSYPLYVLAFLALIAVELGGESSGGSQRWLSLGPLTAQPSELAKLALISALARLLADASGNWERPRHPIRLVVTGLSMAAPLVLLVLLQPDLGTAIVLLIVVLTMLFAGGGSLLFLLLTIVAGAATAPHLLMDYQRQRILAFLNPEVDPLGVGYHLAQSRVAVSSGGFWGRGLFQGPLTQGHFVPANDTDFILTVIGEELGLIGCGGLLILFVLLFLNILWTAVRARERFGAALCFGIVIVLSFQLVVNLAMVLGHAPVVGIPLPFCSYGGSSAFASAVGLGLTASVANSRSYAHNTNQGPLAA